MTKTVTMSEQDILSRKLEVATELVNQIVESGRSVTENIDDWAMRAYEFRELGEQGLALYHRLSEMDGFKYDSHGTTANFRSACKRQEGSYRGKRTLQSFFHLCKEMGLKVPSIEGVTVNAQTLVTNYVPEIDPEKADTLADILLEQYSQYEPTLHKALVEKGYLGEEQWQRAKEMYQIGGMLDGSIIYWQIDHKGRVRDGKVMMYDERGHRVKGASGVTWMSSILKYRKRDHDGNPMLEADWKGCHCMFGEHLLKRRDTDVVALVESEKTALVMSQICPDAIWVAVGGLRWLYPENFKVLKGKRIVVFPDTDPNGSTFKLWQKICKNAEPLIGQIITISDVLEQNANRQQKQQKIDILDFINEK